MSTLIEALVQNVIDTNYNALPTDVVEATKKQILDTLGTTVAGSTSPKIKELVGLVKDWGGKEESTVVAYGGKVPCPNAALLNAMFSMRRDYDDTHIADRIHPSRTIVPPAFAIAEYKGAVGGKDFIAAAALGLDLECRLVRAGRLGFYDHGFGHATSIFGATTVASKILGLSKENLKNAFSIAFVQLSGAGGHDGYIKGFSGGLAAKGGIIAALMAENGFTGRWDCFEGRGGLYYTVYRNMYTPELVTVDLGKVFEGTTVSQKAYPCGHRTHTDIETTLALVREHDIKPDDVAEVTVSMGAQDLHMYEERKRTPQDAIASQFSGYWHVASALVHRRVNIDNFTEEALRDKKTLEMTGKISPKLNPELNRTGLAGPAIVEIKTKDGQVYSKRVEHPFGTPENPMTFDDVVEKFKYCCGYSVKPIPQENQNKVIKMVKGIEEVTDVSQIVRLLAL